jgi:bifunctional non-homologous end joining protein LigD
MYRVARRRSPAGFIEPCLPSNAPRPPAGDQSLHEVKQDGFRLMARRDATGVRLLTRDGHDWTSRFPQIAAAATGAAPLSGAIDM